jgi:tetratricopeptide (TPR) repeat protein
MSQRLSRKDMKRDEFANVVGRSVEYAETHTRNLLILLGAVIVVGALAGAVYAVSSRRAATAQEALGRAIKVYAAPIQAAADAKPNDPGSPSFPSEAARNQRAAKLLTAVRDGYGHTQAAAIAGVYLGRIAAGEGKLDEARRLWSDYADGRKDSLAAMVRLDLIELDRRQGKGEELVGRLRPMLDDSEPLLPKDTVLYQLGLTYEQLQRRPEAAGAYRQIVDEFPQSAYRQEAQQKLASLDPSRAASPFGAGGMEGLGLSGGGVPPGA